jgi:hypothetical protein
VAALAAGTRRQSSPPPPHPTSGGADPIAVVAEEEPAVAERRGRGVLATDLSARMSSRWRRISISPGSPSLSFPSSLISLSLFLLAGGGVGRWWCC